jgi:hypothetical protein
MPTHVWIEDCRGFAFGWGALASVSSAKKPPNTAVGLKLDGSFRHSKKHPPQKTNSSSQIQRFSLRLVFLSPIRFRAKSSAPVSSSCQSRLCSSARRINENRAVLASAPFGSAPLRRLTAPPCAPYLAIYETNVFFWPAKGQIQPEAHPKCPATRHYCLAVRPSLIPYLNRCSIPMRPLNYSKSTQKPCSTWRAVAKFPVFKSESFGALEDRN